ncbi:hypothetical protein DMUE_3212 [Dictyocoela muelleri]|nr:hypothetical protein DMUE_3212 [Dictyocoela muelleri]
MDGPVSNKYFTLISFSIASLKSNPSHSSLSFNIFLLSLEVQFLTICPSSPHLKQENNFGLIQMFRDISIKFFCYISDLFFCFLFLCAYDLLNNFQNSVIDCFITHKIFE